MHYKTKEAAIKKHSEAGFESVAVLTQAIKSDHPDATDEEVSDIVNGIIFKKQSVDKPAEVVNMPPPKSLYDKWRGHWLPLKEERVRGSKDVLITEWIFETLEMKPNKTGIPLTAREVDLFNSTRFRSEAKVPTEQVLPHGTKPEVVYFLNDQNRWELRLKTA